MKLFSNVGDCSPLMKLALKLILTLLYLFYLDVFLIGVLFSVLVKDHGSSVLLRCFLMIGLLGGFTTFSSFSLNVMNSLAYGNLSGALMNVLLSVGCSLLGCYAGIQCGRLLLVAL